jgi:hypothetical protein
MPMFIQLDVNKSGKIVAWTSENGLGPWSFAVKGNTPSQVLRAIAAKTAKTEVPDVQH